jgi:aldose 1-epimerase
MSLSLSSKKFGKNPSGDEVTLFTLSLSKKVSLSVMDYGATWTHLFIPDRNGKMEDVLLGFDSMKGYNGSRIPGQLLLSGFDGRENRRKDRRQ